MDGQRHHRHHMQKKKRENTFLCTHATQHTPHGPHTVSSVFPCLFFVSLFLCFFFVLTMGMRQCLPMKSFPQRGLNYKRLHLTSPPIKLTLPSRPDLQQKHDKFSDLNFLNQFHQALNIALKRESAPVTTQVFIKRLVLFARVSVREEQVFKFSPAP